MLQQSKLKLEIASINDSSFSSLMFMDHNDGSWSYTVHYLAINVGTSKKVGLSLIEKSKIIELDERWKKQGKQNDHYHLKWNALKREQKKDILE